MDEKTKGQPSLQWQPAFFADIQIEFAEEAEYLTFENEHQLGTKPKEIDVLIIKKDTDGQYFPIQFLVTSRLKDEENFWLHHLNHRLKSGKEARELLRQYEKNKDNNLYQSVMDLIIRANQKIFKEESVVCEALMEIIQEKYELELEAREEIGEINKLKEQIRKKLQKGKSIEQIANELEETTETIEKMIREMTLPADSQERG